MELLSTFVRTWRARAAFVLPSYADDDHVMTSAAALLALSAVSDADGSAAAVDGIVSDAEGLATWARLADMRHGDVSPERDTYSWVREQVDTFRADGTLVDTVPAHAPAPEPMDGSKHTVRRGRNKRGATAVVTGFGVAHVIGSWQHDSSGALTPEHLSTLPTVMGVRSGAVGTNVLDVLAVTNRAYRGDIPELLSTDVRQREQMIHAGHGAVDEYNITHHNPRDLFGAAGLTDDRVVGPITYPTRGAGLLAGLPDGAVTDRERAIAWIASHRDSDATTAARDASRCDVVTFVPTVARQVTRTGLRTPRKRKHDVAPRRVTLANGYCLTGIAELLAPAADVDHMWRGHVLVARPLASGGTTVRGKRVRTARVKRTQPDVFHAATRAELLARFATVPAGGRLVWVLGPIRGTFTLSPNKRHNIGVKSPAGDVTASRRTLTALDRIIERQAWLATQPA